MESPSNPSNAIAAVTAADPYPYYADLIARSPFYRDESLGMWIASSAAAVEAVMTSGLCRVRPVGEPVPAALAGSPAGKIFGQLIRMNDGAGHCPFNRAVAETLDSVTAARLAQRSAFWAAHLVREFKQPSAASRLNRLAAELSTHVLGDLLGLPHAFLSETSRWVGDFVRCVFPSTPEQMEKGKAAAGRILQRFSCLLDTQTDRAGLLFRLEQEAINCGRPDTSVVLANAIGFLSQAYEATAGLIGNSLVTLASNHATRAQVIAERSLLPAFISEVLRHDPPTHNTRRFVAADAVVFGQAINAGDIVLVVLAAANRDPAANSNPERFDLRRADRKIFTFGAGAHACPGDAYAVAIAGAGIAALLDCGLDLERLGSFSYRTSANTRVPVFTEG